jgi:class 3 adenylate cyclase
VDRRANRTSIAPTSRATPLYHRRDRQKPSPTSQLGTPPAAKIAPPSSSRKITGYSRLFEVSSWCSCWHEIVKPSVIAHDGRIVKSTGDGFVAEFALPGDAGRCALAIQTAVNQRRNTVSLRRLLLRMGIHVCHVVPCGTDIFGHGVNIAARLQAEASPGTICISARARRAIGSPENYGFLDLGFRCLKNIDEPLQIYVIEPRDWPERLMPLRPV